MTVGELGAGAEDAPEPDPRGAGVRCLLDLVHLARADDAGHALGAPHEAELAAGIQAYPRPLPQAVVPFAVGRRSTVLCRALARRLAGGTPWFVAPADMVRDQLLGLADPVVDEELMFPADGGPPFWVHRAILRERRGPDGRAVIPRAIRARMLEAGADVVNRSRRPGFSFRGASDVNLLELLMYADDPALVLMAMTASGRRRRAAFVIRGFLTLYEHGVLADVWHDPRLAEEKAASAAEPWGALVARMAEGDADAVAELRPRAEMRGARWGARVVAEYEDTAYPVRWAARPDREDLARIQKQTVARSPAPAVRHAVIRTALLRGMAYQSLSASDLLCHVEPAAEVVALADPDHLLTGRPDRRLETTERSFPSDVVERGRAELRAALAGLLQAAFGDDQRCWDAVIEQAAHWPGTVAGLVARILEQGPDELPVPTARAPRWPRGVDAAGVLLTLAPPRIAEGFVAAQGDPARRGIVTRALDRGPEVGVLVRHALGPDGTTGMRTALARNPATSRAVVLALAARDPAEPEVLRALCLRPELDQHLRGQLVRRCGPGMLARFVARMCRRGEHYALPLLMAQDFDVVFRVLKQFNGRADEGRRAIGYATLAAGVGLEAVWALELERAGSLRAMAPAVRTSMQTGDTAPLLDAGATAARRLAAEAESQLRTAPRGDGPRRSEHRPWPLADLVRDHLDGSPERWRTVARLLADGAHATPEHLVAWVADRTER